MNELAPRVAYPQSFGAMLRGARERRGLSVGDISSRLRLHAKQVRALEAEDLSALPEAPYTRGFLRNYARELDLDATPLLAAYDARAAETSAAAAPVDASPGLVGPVAAVRRRAPGDGGRRLILVAVIAVLAVLAVVGGIANRRGDRPGAGRDLAAARHEAAPPAAEPAAAEPAAPPVQVPSPPAEAAAAPPPAAPTPPPAAPVPGAALVLRFNRESWIEVTQADGRVVMSRLDPAGAQEQITGSAPLNVTIGNAPGVEVEYRGKRIDLAPYTRADAVAHLTLP